MRAALWMKCGIMVWSWHRRLQRHAGGLASGAGADRLVAAGDLVEHAPAAETVGDDFR